jgi:3-hydroxyisobutyrate dehydrogenase-like beta-hydroxyacid dehydrogenase
MSVARIGWTSSLRSVKPTAEITNLFKARPHEVVISMLPDDTAVRDVVLGRADLGTDGLASGLKRGAIHLSMSTIGTSTASHLARSMHVTGKATGSPLAIAIRGN